MRIKQWRRRQAISETKNRLKIAFAQTGIKQRSLHEFRYVADSWNRERHLVTQLEFGAQGPDPRFVVTHLELPANALYDRLYCLRGEADPFKWIELEGKPEAVNRGEATNKIGSRKHNWTSSAPAPVAVNSSPTGCA